MKSDEVTVMIKTHILVTRFVDDGEGTTRRIESISESGFEVVEDADMDNIGANLKQEIERLRNKVNNEPSLT